MRLFRRIAALATLAACITGCAGPADRAVILSGLDPDPMPESAYSRVAGTYTGPIRSTSQRGGFEGESTMETRLDLSGWTDSPEVLLRIDSAFSTAWAMYGERKGLYTNIPSKRYGAQGSVYASTHAPDKLLLHLRRFGASRGTDGWMILTFRGNGVVDVDWIGHSGWRGDGELSRVPGLQKVP